jgi:hypothetical protein
LKKGILLLLALFGFIYSYAQQTDEDYVGGGNTTSQPTGNSDRDKWRARENLFYGGGLGLGYANGWLLNINPQVGVKYKNFIGAGVGLDYQYYGNTANNVQTIGPSVFTRAKAFNAILLQAEYVQLYYKETYLGQRYSYNAPMFLVGGGYQDGDENGGLFLMVLWDLIQDPYNPLPMPIIRAGISIGF